jgi:hypothetical protein
MITSRLLGRPTRFALLLATLLGSLVSARGAAAQGTSGAFPDPISSGTLDRFADLLGLDAAERAELGPFHEAYRQKMRELRDGAIDAWLKQHGGGGGAIFGSSKPRAEVEEAVRKRTQILGQIEKAERELVDRIAVGIPPEQADRVERVRRLADRERARGLFGPFGGRGASQLELRELCAELELDAATMPLLDPALDEYERKLTKLLEELATAAVKQPLAMTDAIAAAGLKRPSPASPPVASPEAGEAAPAPAPPEASAEMERYFRELGKIRAAVAAPQRETRATIAKLNRDTVTKLRALLPPESCDELADRFLTRAYSQIAGDPDAAGKHFDAALRLAAKDSADAGLREALTAAKAEWRTRYDAIANDLMDAVDESRREGDGFFFSVGDDDVFRRHEEKLNALREKRTALNTSAREQARGLLGPELAAKLGGGRAPEGAIAIPAGAMIEALDSSIEMVGMDGDMVVMVSGASLDGMAPMGAGPLPRPISASELRTIDRRLEVGETLRPILEVMHGEYEAAFNEARDESLHEIAVASGDDESAKAAAGEEAPVGATAGAVVRTFMPRSLSEQQITRRHEAFRRGVQKLEEIDRTFFDDLQAVLEGTPAGPRIGAVRSARERMVLRKATSGPGGGGMMFGIGGGGLGGNEADVDLFELTPTLAEPSQQAVVPILVRYGEQATTASRQRFETSIVAQKEVDLFHAKAMQVQDGGRVEVTIDDSDDGFATMQKASKRIAEAAEQVATLNRSTRDEILAAIPEAERLAFTRAYNRVAWPGVYRDRAAAKGKLEAAAALDDLTDDQRSRIAALAAEHVEAYEKLCDDMVAAEQSGGVPSMGMAPDPEAIRKFTERQNEIKKLRFERTERSASTLRALGGLLTPEQVERIGGVAMPEAKERRVIEFGN